MKKSNLITIVIILAVIIFSIIILNKPSPETSEEVAKCIGENSILYVQLGCHACERQKEMFGENYEFLNIIDCWFERDRCDGITATPTWEIKGDRYEEVQNIERLKQLTGCE